MSLRLRNSFILLLVALLLFSCDEKRVFDEYKSVGKEWHKDSVVTFELPQLDAKKMYNFKIVKDRVQPPRPHKVQTGNHDRKTLRRSR